MDITEIEVPRVIDNKSLEKMFNLQKGLLFEYIERGSLPEFPLDITTKENQNIIRDFIGYIIEELSEAYEAYFLLVEKKENNDLSAIDAINGITQFNEELADTLHFVLELMIYCNIDPESIHRYYAGVLKYMNLADAILFPDILKSAMSFAGQSNWRMGLNERNPRGFTLFHTYEITNALHQGGRIVSLERLAEYEKLLWKTTYLFNKVLFTLKNKPWKQTQVKPDGGYLQESIMEAFMMLCQFLNFTGHDEVTVFGIYYAKNQINQERIKNNY